MILCHSLVSLWVIFLGFFFVFKPEKIQRFLTNLLWGKTNEKSWLIRYYKSELFKVVLRFLGIMSIFMGLVVLYMTIKK